MSTPVPVPYIQQRLMSEDPPVAIPMADEVDPDTGDVILFRGAFDRTKLHGYYMTVYWHVNAARACVRARVRATCVRALV
jgi:hypothetical protein